MHGFPEEIAGEVFCTPASQTPAAGWCCDVGFEPLDEGSAVFQNSSVCSNPNLKNAAFSSAVEAVQNEAAEIVIAAKSDDAVACMCFLVGLVCEKSDAMGITTGRGTDEEDQFSEVDAL